LLIVIVIATSRDGQQHQSDDPVLVHLNVLSGDGNQGYLGGAYGRGAGQSEGAVRLRSNYLSCRTNYPVERPSICPYFSRPNRLTTKGIAL
jgi:hypothetical protein